MFGSLFVRLIITELISSRTVLCRKQQAIYQQRWMFKKKSTSHVVSRSFISQKWIFSVAIYVGKISFIFFYGNILYDVHLVPTNCKVSIAIGFLFQMLNLSNVNIVTEGFTQVSLPNIFQCVKTITCLVSQTNFYFTQSSLYKILKI